MITDKEFERILNAEPKDPNDGFREMREFKARTGMDADSIAVFFEVSSATIHRWTKQRFNKCHQYTRTVATLNDLNDLMKEIPKSAEEIRDLMEKKYKHWTAHVVMMQRYKRTIATDVDPLGVLSDPKRMLALAEKLYNKPVERAKAKYGNTAPWL